ncbi:unnamed protein product [Calicophoron daubneyi]|uniref:BPTI/Kunitz inhibitor domain-containing protein n=1 Tax=Calicophoron daubneyi TaxID=300641 RepID=A0AAV2TNH1_CALDB
MRQILLQILAIVGFLFMNCIGGYVYEGKRIVKPVYFKRRPLVLFASTGYDPNPARNEFRSGLKLQRHPRNHRTPAETAIPPTFIRGAQVRLYDSPISERILSKPKRWAISTPYEPPEPRMSEEQLATTTTEATTTELSSAASDEVEILREVIPSDKTRLTVMYGDQRNYTIEAKVEDVPRTVTEPSDYYIRQRYLPAIEREAAAEDFGMESYSPYISDEQAEPIRPIRRSAAPWATRDTDRLGPPRQQACNLELDRGFGPDELSSWYYNPSERKCRWFGYRGNGGNANRFNSRTACEAYCVQDVTNLCDVVSCPWHRTSCQLVADEYCKITEEHAGRDWRLKCPPEQPSCLSSRGTRLSPEVNRQSIPSECHQNVDAGSCQRKSPSVQYFYDPNQNDCKTFYFHNCGGNDNRFGTKSDCMTYCSP